ncbi:hypothetical protein EDF24_2435 [Curtobacterium sp. PhB130]|uniref:hypothetical protein n=1 Tax=unclassified Curtobacterium TaxID=257496 RepID=UPI000F4BD58C|nr:MULTISPECIES: hypothetical protein [unclassified Curtobacterium]ROP64703.1 hypothetical protein EDF55_1353 [Curtobacterium sp. ZW137]ROS74995.1 hypothetical protein EDF24_2435 [Curtobacterium sp. PhB130]
MTETTMTAPQVASRRLGGLRRSGGSAEKIAAAQRELAEAKITAAIERAVADAPPLTSEQRDRLHRIIDGAQPTVLHVSDELRDRMADWADDVAPVLAEADAVQAEFAAAKAATR